MTALEWDTVELMTGSCFDRTALYRFFDADGALLYVGITDNPKRRFAQHRSQAPWWSRADATATTLTWYDGRRDAEKAELQAIEAERPEFNTVGKDGYKGGRRKAILTEEQTRKVAVVVDLRRKQQEVKAEYKAALADLVGPNGDAVPIAYIAGRLGLERKTVYRHLGRSMT